MPQRYLQNLAILYHGMIWNKMSYLNPLNLGLAGANKICCSLQSALFASPISYLHRQRYPLPGQIHIHHSYCDPLPGRDSSSRMSCTVAVPSMMYLFGSIFLVSPSFLHRSFDANSQILGHLLHQRVALRMHGPPPARKPWAPAGEYSAAPGESKSAVFVSAADHGLRQLGGRTIPICSPG